MKKYKKSIDFTTDTINLMENMRNYEDYSSYSDLVNTLIMTFSCLPKEVKVSMSEMCYSEIKKINQELDKLSVYEWQKKNNILEAYNRIRMFLKQDILVEKKESDLRIIDIKDGYVIIPNDWIIVNEELAKNSRYVGVIEVRNGAKYNMPHFVYFSEKPINRMSQEEDDYIDKICIRLYPDYAKALCQYVAPQYNSDGEMINMEEVLAAPVAGHFEIPEYRKDENRNYPYDAMVVKY